jgi:small GTP-binding protein
MLKKYESLNSDNCEEITILILGNVDAGKSTVLGSLVKNKLDDGNGSNRNLILRHPHELLSGRTSDLNYHYVKIDNKIFSYVDNPGHEVYLKTTIRGIMSSYPDLAIICISDKITNITMEHIKLSSMMDIPFIILMTKSDLVPPNITKELINNIKTKLKTMKKPIFNIKDEENFDMIKCNLKSMIPLVQISNKTGHNLNLLKNIINEYPRINHVISKCFTIDHALMIHGFGIILIGITGIDININDELFIGPFVNDVFVQTKIRTIHNDYRFSVDNLKAGSRGCICIKRKLKKNDLSLSQEKVNGLILIKEIPKIYKTISAKIKVMHHSSTITAGYIGYINCGLVRGPVKITKIYHGSSSQSGGSSESDESRTIRTGDICNIDFEFTNKNYYIEVGQKIIIRESFSKLIGIITGMK